MKWLLLAKDQRTLALLLIVCVLINLGWRLRSSERQEINHAKGLTFQFQVDPNNASAAELAQLPGIGQTLAEAIICYREINGPFQTSADLQKVKGIGVKKTAAVSLYLTFQQNE